MIIKYAELDSGLTLLAEMNRMLIADEGHRNAMDVESLRQRMDSWLNKGCKAVLVTQSRNVLGYALWRK